MSRTSWMGTLRRGDFVGIWQRFAKVVLICPRLGLLCESSSLTVVDSQRCWWVGRALDST